MPSPKALQRFADRIHATTRAEVHIDRGRRMLYATDASLYQVEPRGIVEPFAWLMTQVR